MDIIDNILAQVAYSIERNEYIWTDIETIAMTDNCHSPEVWNEVLVTANAFLNTKGGTIIIGIIDDEINSQLTYTGYDHTTGSQLGLIPSAFANATHLAADLDKYFQFLTKPFRDGELMTITITPLTETDKYTYYQGIAWQRIKTGNQRIPGHTLANPSENNTSQVNITADVPVVTTGEPIAETDVDTRNQQHEPTDVAFQKIYSGELITLFGADYISLEPDFKQLLSFIYERNNETELKYPTQADICSKLWVIRGEVNTPKGFELFEQKVKKILTQMEKSGFISRHSSKGGYVISPTYQVVKNLFN